MYNFKATLTNSNTILIESDTYWNCSVYGNFKLSKYNGNGNDEIEIIVPEDIMYSEGDIYFSYGDERCEYPVISVYTNNKCFIRTNPNYIVCDNKKIIPFQYKEKGETFTIDILSFNDWTVEANGFDYITDNNGIMVIASGNDGEINIIPGDNCNKDTIYIKLKK